MKHDLTTRKYERRARKLYALFSCLVLALTVMVVPAFAADDPLTVVNNLVHLLPDSSHRPDPAGLRRPPAGPVPQEP